jgi:arsenate reductase
MLTVYGIPNCNTMKKTFDWLKEHEIEYIFHDYKKKGVDSTTLQSFLKELGENVTLNKQGSTFKQLTEAQKTSLNSNEHLFEFLTNKPSAIKRPILEKNGEYLAGFDLSKLEEFLLK